MNQDTKHSPICVQCNAELILVSKVTEKLEGSRFPQTTSIYRCSNNECQQKKDKETEKRIEAQKEKDIYQEKRNKLRHTREKSA